MCRYSRLKVCKNNTVSKCIFCLLDFLNHRCELHLKASVICVLVVKRVKVSHLSDFDESINVTYFELLTVVTTMSGLH